MLHISGVREINAGKLQRIISWVLQNETKKLVNDIIPKRVFPIILGVVRCTGVDFSFTQGNGD